MNLKKENGFALADTTIAIAIVVIFTGLIVSISYSIYLGSNFIKRNDRATNYIVELLEYAKTLEFDELDNNLLITYINSKNDDALKAESYTENPTKLAAFTMLIRVNDNFDDNDYNGLIKKVDVKVFYKLGNKQREVSMSTLINK